MKSQQQYIEEVSKIHNGKYNYSSTIYNGSGPKDMIEVNCPSHGAFRIAAVQHRRGKGCQKCSLEARSKSHVHSFEEFVEIASQKYGGKYYYVKPDTFNGELTVVEIICPEHGSFYHTARGHKNRRGCTKCSKSGFKFDRPAYLYVLEYENIFKVGITNNAPKTRLYQLNSDSGYDFRAVQSFYSDNGKFIWDLEKRVLCWLRENFTTCKQVFSGSTECFYSVPIDKLLLKINTNLGTGND